MGQKKSGFWNRFRAFFSDKTVLKILFGIGAFSLLLLVLFAIRHVHVYSDWVVTEATCTTGGHRYRTCTVCGKVESEDSSPNLQHSFGEWNTVEESQLLTYGKEVRICSLCGLEESRPVRPVADMPQLFLSGHGTISVDNGLNLEGYYRNGVREGSFHAKIFVDGYAERSSKYSYVMHGVSSEEGDSFSDFFGVHSSSYLLYGGNYDAAGGRFSAVSSLWQSVTADSGDAAVDAFNRDSLSAVPVLLYINEKYFGVFTLALPVAGESLFDVSRITEHQRALVYTAYDNDAASFRAPADEYSVSYIWSDDGEKDWVYDSFNAMMSFVTTKSDLELTDGLSRYLDVGRSLDYFLTAQLTGTGDNLVKGIVWMTTDGVCWRPVFAYPALSFGLSSSDELAEFRASRYRLSENDSLLWSTLLRYYPQTLRRRYAALRQTAFSDESLTRISENCFLQIPQEAIDADNVKYIYSDEGAPHTAQEIVSWLTERLRATDALFGG